MNADERSALVSTKVERAEKHIFDLELKIKAFLATKPYRVVHQVNANTGQHECAVSFVAPVPSDIACIIGDCIQNLRSALDHLANQLLLVQIGAISTNENLNFPIAGSRQKYESVIARSIQPRVRSDAFAAIQRLEAYKGGNGHEFWTLNRLNNIDKHRLLLAVGSGNRSINLGGIMWRSARRHWFHEEWTTILPPMNMFLRPADNQCPLEIGDVLLTGVDPSDVDPDVDFRFDIALNEPQIVEGKAVIETLKHFSDLVRATIISFKGCLQ